MHFLYYFTLNNKKFRVTKFSTQEYPIKNVNHVFNTRKKNFSVYEFSR